MVRLLFTTRRFPHRRQHPQIPEAVVAMLACARIGAVHSVVFGGFAPEQLAVRIDDAAPKVVVSASCGIEAARVIQYKPLLDEAISLSKSKVGMMMMMVMVMMMMMYLTLQPSSCVIVQRPQARASLVQGRDIEWTDAIQNYGQPAACVHVDATDPLYVLYTSGTTGQPKGVVRENGGHAVAIQWALENVFDMSRDDVWWAASDIGWVVR